MLLSESRERSSEDGKSYGSLVDYESQKIEKTVLSTTVAELYSFMECLGSCQFLRGLWMDISGEVADIHMRTDATNLVKTARTTHLPEQKETIHMMSMLRKEACSGSIHDLAHIPTQNCLANCLTKVSAKVEKLITAVKTRGLLDVDIHPNFRTPIEHKAFPSTWCRTFMHTREKNIFFLNALKISLSPTPREAPSHVMFVRTLTDSENQDATKNYQCKLNQYPRFTWGLVWEANEVRCKWTTRHKCCAAASYPSLSGEMRTKAA